MGKFKDFMKSKTGKMVKAAVQSAVPGGSLMAAFEENIKTPQGEANHQQVILSSIKDGIKLLLWVLVITGKIGWEEAEQASEFILGE